jgi:tetratricopeptide (TPR) repeat protein
MAKVVALLLLLVTSASAWAQSKHYPKKAVDEDRVREEHSDLWDSATHPAKGPYKDAIDEARAKLGQRQDDARLAAIQILDHAIALAPDDPLGYQLRGQAFLDAREWKRCADDLAAAVHHSKREAPLKWEVKRDLGVCQARAGRLAEAERTLADAAAGATRNSDVWTRLGETRIALGKLDEAKAALDTAIDTADGAGSAGALWLRAAAYDRARQPSQAEEDIRRALGYDRTRSLIENPQLPLLGTGEHEYIVALSYADNDPRDVEYALVYFRRFVELAPNSPWRKRADEHLRDLHAMELPLTVVRASGAIVFDQEAAAKAVRSEMPQMRACMTKLPGTLMEVRITKVGPRTPDNAPDRPRIRPPLDSVIATPKLDLDANREEGDSARRCIEALAAKITMPAVKEHDSWYVAGFYVVGN